jgi:hypothetical protein
MYFEKITVDLVSGNGAFWKRTLQPYQISLLLNGNYSKGFSKNDEKNTYSNYDRVFLNYGAG